ncbi:MAG: carboxyltransferase domain-containing protein [Catenulisporales bacterium]|nr:carboxyltransferase domain-containing protein [Catenulisporales bacterium]
MREMGGGSGVDGFGAEIRRAGSRALPNPRPKVLPAGPFGALLELSSLSDVQRCFAWVERWRARRPGVLVDVVPAERTLMVIATFDDAGQRGLREFVAALGDVDWAASELAGGSAPAEFECVELPVEYDGPDLEEVARLTGLGVDEVVALHTGTEFTVAFTGFAPGFAYLTGLPEALQVPRRDAPRTRVAAGSVALGGTYSGVYPRESPGGWRLIGRLALGAPVLWDEGRGAPALLRPGMRVRFRDVGRGGGVAAGGGRQVRAGDDAAGGEVAGAGGDVAWLRVVRAGPLATVQDLGRAGFAQLGVPRSGAVDRGALRLANRLVGNAEGMAGLELTLAGGVVELGVGRWCAVAGARCEVRVFVGGGAEGSSLLSPAPSHQLIMQTVPGTAFYAPPGAVVDVGPATTGVRAYLAVAGGVGGVEVLGSRASDLLAGVGGRALKEGDLLPLGTPAGLPPDIPGLGLAPSRDPVDPVVVRVVAGPRSDWFAQDALRMLGTERWEVGTDSNRTAVRLEGPALQRARDGEPASEPMVVGALQVPPDGRPVLFLADHPVTGGYPVIACAHPADLDAVGQSRPGTGIRFRMVGGWG